MNYKEIKFDLFKMDKKYYLVHCISLDLKMRAGIAKEFQKRFMLREKILNLFMSFPQMQKYPSCIKINRVFNLITKKYYYNKPTYISIKKSLIDLCRLVNLQEIKFLAMPKIGCGLDKLKWVKVKKIIQKVFENIDIEIVVCYL